MVAQADGSSDSLPERTEEVAVGAPENVEPPAATPTKGKKRKGSNDPNPKKKPGGQAKAQAQPPAAKKQRKSRDSKKQMTLKEVIAVSSESLVSARKRLTGKRLLGDAWCGRPRAILMHLVSVGNRRHC